MGLENAAPPSGGFVTLRFTGLGFSDRMAGMLFDISGRIELPH
jgi:hypothetical protein